MARQGQTVTRVRSYRRRDGRVVRGFTRRVGARARRALGLRKR